MMSRLALILFLAGAYVGCATRAPAPAPLPQPAPPAGGELRILVGTGLTERDVVTSAVAGSLSPGAGLVDSIASVDGAAGVCFRLRLSGRYPDGSAVRASDVIADWEARLRDAGSALRWLLHDVRGVEGLLDGSTEAAAGLAERDGELEVCVTGSGRDFERRLAHPALAHRRREDDRLVGPGPFRETARGTLSPNPDHLGGRPALEGIRAIDSASDPVLLFRLNEVDLALVYGRVAAALGDDRAAAVELRPAERWDRRYFLWIDPSGRWLGDPAFRAWLAASVDRQALVRFLFAGLGRPIASLSPGGVAATAPTPAVRRPFSSTSRVRLTLDFDRADLPAAAIAGRLRAALALEGVELELRGRAAGELREALAEGRAPLALLVHRPALEDPVLALLETFWWLGGGAARSVGRLRRAGELADPGLRADAAWLAEHELLTEDRLVPLVRVEARLARAAGLDGVALGPAGRLELAAVRWVR